MKQPYIPPTIEIDEYRVEHGYAASSSIDIDDPPIRSSCNCRGWDCSCNRRADCKGSGIDGCHSKFGLNDYSDELFY